MIRVILFGCILFATIIKAQVPSYVPTNGLVAWYPFNGNANDESGNGNNLVNFGASLVADRVGSCNSAYLFNPGNYLFKSSPNTSGQSFTWSIWMKKINSDIESHGIAETNNGSTSGGGFGCSFNIPQFICQGISTNVTNSTTTIGINAWYHYVVTKSGTQFKIYINGALNSSGNSSYLAYNSTTYLRIGGNNISGEAIIDDVSMWNRELTQAEIQNLFASTTSLATNAISIQPPIQSGLQGSSVQFSLTPFDSLATYQWQTNPIGTGWISLPNNSIYSGVNSAILNITNIVLANHNQPFRAILNQGNCHDTSNMAYLNIIDTCIQTISIYDTTNVTIYDTVNTYLSVTDTLVINQTITGLVAPNNTNTIRIFPNPANDHVTINYGNYALMSGYSLNITNALGQVVFTTPINLASSYLDISTWGGSGTYFVNIINPQGANVNMRKIVLQ